jgi:putative flippase GtrA
MLRRALKSKKIRFVAVGGLNTLWGLATYPILYFLLTPIGLNYVIILVLAYVAGTVFSFTTQKYLVFKSRGNHFREIAKFLGLQGGILLINIVLLPVLVNLTRWNPVIVQISIGISFAVISYFFHDRVTFRKARDG